MSTKKLGNGGGVMKFGEGEHWIEFENILDFIFVDTEILQVFVGVGNCLPHNNANNKHISF